MTVALLAAGLVTGCGSSASPTEAPSRAEVGQLLEQRAAAVRSGAIDQFLATVDPGPAADGFRTAQRAAIENLVRLPLSSWSYAVAAPVTDTGAIRAAAKRYGTPVTILRVRLSYALTGIDTAPDAHDQWLTFVRRDGKTYLAGDDDMTDAGGQSWHGPWDFGPVEAVRSAEAVVIGPRGSTQQLRQVAADVAGAVPTVDAGWGRSWPRRVAVVLAIADAEVTALAGAGTSGDVAAVAVTSGTDPGTGRPYGLRLIIRPHELDRLSPVGRRIVVTHELTHLATAADTSPSTPRWLVEGFAEYVANTGTGQPVRTAAAELARAVAQGQLPTTLPDDARFRADAASAAQAYQESWLACRLIADAIGDAGLRQFYLAVATSPEPPAQALTAALQAQLHETLADFTQRLRAYVVEQLS